MQCTTDPIFKAVTVNFSEIELRAFLMGVREQLSEIPSWTELRSYGHAVNSSRLADESAEAYIEVIVEPHNGKLARTSLSEIIKDFPNISLKEGNINVSEEATMAEP